MDQTDQERWDDEQLKFAIEQSLCDLKIADIETEPLNEFDAQDLAFFTDLAIPSTTNSSKVGSHLGAENEENIYNSQAALPSTSVAEKPNMNVKSRAGNDVYTGRGTYATPAAKTTGSSSTLSNNGLLGKLTSLISNNSNSNSNSNSSNNTKSGTQGCTNRKDLCRACQHPCTTSVFNAFGTVRANNDLYHSDCFICNTCRNPIRGQYLQHSHSKYPYHPDCFLCTGCNGKISGNFKDYGDPPAPYHANCYKELFNPRCCLCTHTLEGQFYKHPFFESEIYCMSHESLPSCFACSRKQPLPASRREGFAELMDGRSLCAQCSSSIIVDSSEAVALYKGIVEFMGRELGLTIPEGMMDVPVLVVDVQSLNENMNRKDGSLGYHDSGGEGTAAGVSTVRGVTLSTCCEVRHFSGGSAAYSQVAGAFRTGQAPVLFQTKEVRDVTAVLVLYGLPKDLIASILAHEAMHVWLKLNKGYPFRMPPKLEEGLCQVIAYLYLESIRAYDASTAVRPLDAEKDASLRSYFCKQIRDDLSPVYGDGFRDAYQAVQLLGLDIVLEYVQQNQQLPEIS